MTRTMCDVLLLNSVATNYPTTYKGESVIEILEILFNDHEAQIKAKDDEIRRLNNLYADTIKDLGDALIEIERLKAGIKQWQKNFLEA